MAQVLSDQPRRRQQAVAAVVIARWMVTLQEEGRHHQQAGDEAGLGPAWRGDAANQAGIKQMRQAGGRGHMGRMGQA